MVGATQVVRAYAGTTEVWRREVPSNELWYTSTDNQIVTPNITTGYGATISSNVYSDGLGVITFNGTITSIPASGFSGCTTIQTIGIPDSVTSIGIRAFASVSGLTQINISDYVTSIGDRAFQACTSATSINIGSGMRTFGNKTFANTGVVSVTIPDTVTNLGSETFLDCKSLVEATIGSGVTNIGTYCLGRCTKLATINYNGTKSQWNSITKGSNWHVNSITNVVHCTDGDVNI